MQLPPASPELRRDIGPLQATSLNVANMVGIGPFVTIPLFIAAMGGPQAMIAWVIAAVLVICDGMVWAELGAALPGSGGTWHFLRRCFSGTVWGRLLPFLFIWQFLFSGTLEIASGYIGTMSYLEYALPGLKGWLQSWLPGDVRTMAALLALLVTLLLCRRTSSMARLAVILCAGSLVTVLIIIICGLTHFDASKLAMPADAWKLDSRWFGALGAAMTIAVYDYIGYYNICHMGDEVRNPSRTIPRAVLWSIVIVAAVYLVMNISIIAVVPWQEAMASQNIAALFMERLFGEEVARGLSWLVIWTAVACFFCIKAGYSRIPYAAARGGDFFPAFARLHPRHGYPWVALLAIGLLSSVFCYFSLQKVIDAAVTTRIVIQFGGQIAAIVYIRRKRPDIVLPFRMWLYPVPALIAACGWIFLLTTSSSEILLIAAGVMVSGVVVWFGWQRWLKIRGASAPA